MMRHRIVTAAAPAALLLALAPGVTHAHDLGATHVYSMKATRSVDGATVDVTGTASFFQNPVTVGTDTL